MLDMNASGEDGEQALREAHRQFGEIGRLLLSANLQTLDGEVPFWHDPQQDLPDYWIELKGLKEWLVQWDEAFSEALGKRRHAG